MKKGFLLNSSTSSRSKTWVESRPRDSSLLSLETSRRRAERPWLLVSDSSNSCSDNNGADAGHQATDVRELVHVEPVHSNALISPVATRNITKGKQTEPVAASDAHTLADSCGKDVAYSQQGWMNQLSLVLLRIQHIIREHVKLTDGIAYADQSIQRCQDIAADFVDHIIMFAESANTQDHPGSNQQLQLGLLKQIWLKILPSIGDTHFPGLPLCYSYVHPHTETVVHLYGLTLQTQALPTLTPSFFVAFSILQHPCPRGWVSIFALGQDMYKQAYDENVVHGKTCKLILLGLLYTIILQSHSILAAFYSTENHIQKVLSQQWNELIPLFMVTGLPFLLTLARASSENGLRLTPLSSKAQEASCTMVEILSYIIAQGTLHPSGTVECIQHNFCFNNYMLQSYHESLQRLFTLSRLLAIAGNQRIKPVDSRKDSDDTELQIHSRLARIESWVTDMNVDEPSELYRWSSKVSNRNNSNIVPSFTRDLCRIHRFQKK